MASDVQRQRERLAKGEQLEAGWCFNGDRDPDIFKCSEEEQRIAAGEISVSYDGTKVTDRKSGEMAMRDRPKAYRMTAGTMTTPTAPATGADTVTTDNTPVGGRGGARRT